MKIDNDNKIAEAEWQAFEWWLAFDYKISQHFKIEKFENWYGKICEREVFVQGYWDTQRQLADYLKLPKIIRQFFINFAGAKKLVGASQRKILQTRREFLKWWRNKMQEQNELHKYKTGKNDNDGGSGLYGGRYD